MTAATSETSFNRRVELEVPLNFRDLGGYRTPAGLTRPGRLFRSDVLSGLPEADLDRLLQLGLKTVVDLRHSRELQSEPNSFATNQAILYRHHPMLTDAANVGTQADHLQTLDFAWLNCHMVRESGRTIAAIFALVADNAALPLVFHCSGGRDRTGVVAALILTAAGVARQTVLDDYILSNTYLVKRVERMSKSFSDQGIDPAPIIANMHLRESNLATMLDLIDSEYHGIEPYLAHIGVTTNQLSAFRQNFVESN